MKKILLIAFCLFVAFNAFGQVGTEISKTTEISVTIDSSTTETVYYYFPRSLSRAEVTGTTSGFSATAGTPSPQVYNTGDLSIYAKITLASGTEASDSLQISFQPIGHDGYVMGFKTYYFNWTSNTVTTTAPTGVPLVKDWSLFSSSPTLGSSAYSFDMELTGSYPPCHGFVFTIDLNDGNLSGSGDGVYTCVLYMEEVR